MEYEPTITVFHHGPDDYSVWLADLPAETTHEATPIVSNVKEPLAVMEQVPLVTEAGNTLYLLSKSDSGFTLSKLNVSAEFLIEHAGYGCSLRGTAAQVQDEILDACQALSFGPQML